MKYEHLILAGLQGKHVYAGTVPAATVAKNRVARRTRAAQRRKGS